MTAVLRTAGAGLLFLCGAIAAIGDAWADGPYSGRPAAVPGTAGSVFDPALNCMDELLMRSNIANGRTFNLLAQPLEDKTNKMGATQDMIVDAATKMSRRSQFFKIFYDVGGVPADPANFATRGSITSFDEQVESKDTGGGLALLSMIGGDYKYHRGTSVLTVSLSLMHFSTELVPGTFHSNSLTIQNKSRGGMATSTLSLFGGSLSLESSASDGPQAGTKALIDLAMIEAVGSLAQVPYATCLALVSPSSEQLARWKQFRRLKPQQQRGAVVAQLVARGLVRPDPSAIELRQAITVFERSQGMAPTGEVNFELFEALDRLTAMPAPMNRPAGASPNPSVRIAGAQGVFQYPPGGLPIANFGDRLAFQVTVAEPAYVACYYTDAQGEVTRLFPNRARPAYRLLPGETLRFPNEQDSYVIKPLVRNAGEWVTCFAGADNFLPRIAGAVPDAGLAPYADIHSAMDLVIAINHAAPDLATDTMTYRVSQ